MGAILQASTCAGSSCLAFVGLTFAGLASQQVAPQQVETPSLGELPVVQLFDGREFVETCTKDLTKKEMQRFRDKFGQAETDECKRGKREELRSDLLKKLDKDGVCTQANIQEFFHA